MPGSNVYKRRRDHVMRENPKFFQMGEQGAPRRRNSIIGEYERLVAAAAYGRYPTPGSKRPEGGVIPITPPLKALDINLSRGGVGQDHNGPELLGEISTEKGKKEERAYEKSHRLIPEDIVLKPKVEPCTTDHIDHAIVVQSPTTDAIEWAAEPADDRKDTVKDIIGQPALDTDDFSTLVANDNFNMITAPSSELMVQMHAYADRPMISSDWATVEERGATNVLEQGWNTVRGTRASRSTHSIGAEAPPNSRGCFNCGQEGHRKIDCPNPPKGSGRTCRACGDEGHISRDCPHGKPSGGGGGGGGRNCFQCGEPGHKSFDCPNGPGNGDGGKGKPRGCYNCGDPSHKSFDCPAGGDSRGTGARGCFSCGEPGHKSFECPQGGGATPHQYQSGGGTRNRSCYKCGREGHIARNCPGELHDEDQSGSGHERSCGDDNGIAPGIGFDHGHMDIEKEFAEHESPFDGINW